MPCDDGILEHVGNDPDLWMYENSNNEMGNKVTESNDAIHECLNNAHEENPDEEDQNEINEALKQYSEDASGERLHEEKGQNENNETSKEYSDDNKENHEPKEIDIEKTQLTPPQAPKPTSSKQQQNIPGVATPFKNLLFWPEMSPKIPKKVVATCEKWKEYYKKKEEKKVQKQNELEERKRKRSEQQNEKKPKKTKDTKKTQEDESDWDCVICEKNTIENDLLHEVQSMDAQ